MSLELNSTQRFVYLKCLYIKVLSGWFETAVWNFEVIVTLFDL